jgi:hypothetical protein
VSDGIRRYATAILAVKRITSGAPAFHTLLLPNLLASLADGAAVAAVSAAAASLAATAVDADDAPAAALLRDVYATLTSSHAPQRTPVDWSRLGFQNGAKPCSDFRGCGLLALLQLHHLSVHHAAFARGIVARCELPFCGYPLAITSVNMTALAVSLAQRQLLDAPLIALHRRRSDADARTGSYGSHPSMVQDDQWLVQPLHAIHSALLRRFDAAWWAAPPPDVMGFPRVFAAFQASVEELLGRHAEPEQAVMLLFRD